MKIEDLEKKLDELNDRVAKLDESRHWKSALGVAGVAAAASLGSAAIGLVGIQRSESTKVELQRMQQPLDETKNKLQEAANRASEEQGHEQMANDRAKIAVETYRQFGTYMVTGSYEQRCRAVQLLRAGGLPEHKVIAEGLWGDMGCESSGKTAPKDKLSIKPIQTAETDYRNRLVGKVCTYQRPTNRTLLALNDAQRANAFTLCKQVLNVPAVANEYSDDGSVNFPTSQQIGNVIIWCNCHPG